MLKNYLSPQAYELLLAEKAQRLKEQANASLTAPGNSLTDYKHAIYKRYQHAPHLEALDWHLGQVSRYVETGGKEGIWFLIVEMPPRHGKTLTVSRLYPTWHLGRNPDHRMMLVSYGADLAIKNGRFVRNVIGSPAYQLAYPGVMLAKDSKAADAFDIANHEGGVDAIGVLGGAAGKGAHVLVADDLIKNRQEAESELIRDRTWEAFNDDLLTRLEPGGAVILNATRWHMDDPIGRTINEFLPKYPPGRIVRLRLPAIAEENDALGRAPGEALWPWRYPIERLREIETSMGAYSWAALYQQNPVPAEGGLFKRSWFHEVPYAPEIIHAVRFWDLAMSAKTTADHTCSIKLGQAVDGHYYVLDMTFHRIDWGELTDYMAGVMLADGSSVVQGIEEKGYMSRAIQNLNGDSRLHNYSIYGYPKDKDKFTNALPVAAKFAARVIHVVQAHWTPNFIDILCSFTGNNDAVDDPVDAVAGAWEMIGDSGVLVAGGLNIANQPSISTAY